MRYPILQIKNMRLRKGLGRTKQTATPRHGQAMVEFALILPILMLIIVGIFEFGLAYFDSGKVDFTAREVARRLSVCANHCDGFPVLNDGVTIGKYDSTISTVGQLDVYDLDAVANQYQSGPTNAALIDPSLIQYVWIQKVNHNGYAIPVTGTVGSLQWDSSNTATAANPTPSQDWRNYFDYYVYDTSYPGDKYAVPFKPPSNCGAVDPWINNNEFSSANVSGYQSYTPFSSSSTYCSNWRSNPDAAHGQIGLNAGRVVCEPTDDYFVEIGYRHNWITPFIPSGDPAHPNSIMLKTRVRMKVEPQFFSNQLFLTGVPNPNCTSSS